MADRTSIRHSRKLAVTPGLLALGFNNQIISDVTSQMLSRTSGVALWVQAEACCPFGTGTH